MPAPVAARGGPLETRREDETPITVLTGRSPVRVLVIDGDQDARAAIRDALRRSGAEVVELETPVGATAAILGRRIDVAIIDVGSSGDGAERLVALLRSNRCSIAWPSC